MTWIHVFWDFEPGGNADHIAEHGLDPEEVEHVLMNPEKSTDSHSSGRPMVFGYTPSDEYIAVIYEELDDDTVYPVTAYRVEE
jgi:uncharacterized DUF497 family protein